jgi:hypothetical protein
MQGIAFPIFIMAVVFLIATFFDKDWDREGSGKYILSVVGAIIFLVIAIALAF